MDQPSHLEVFISETLGVVTCTFDRCAWTSRYARSADARTPKRFFLLSVVAERCSCEERERDVAEETMSTVVKFVKEIDQSMTPSEKRRVTRRDKLRPRALTLRTRPSRRRMATWTSPGP